VLDKDHYNPVAATLKKETLNEVERKAQHALRLLQRETHSVHNIDELEHQRDRIQINKIYHLTDEGKDLLHEVKQKRNAPYMDYMVAPWISLEEKEKREGSRKCNVRMYYSVLLLNLFITVLKM